MLSNLAKKIFGSRNSRLLKQYRKVVNKINAKEPELEALSDGELQALSLQLKEKVQSGTGLNEVLVDAFALCREASKRVLGMRHFDVQLIGGLALHEGKIAEMRTGEGKTLVATLPVYLNALTGRGVHVVTVNDYLAARDAETMGKLYRFLGMTVGVNLTQMHGEEKQQAYACDITYGTNNEFGFDYLRDNMVQAAYQRVQRPLHFAVVDEVDSILIDEARTPLIISGAAEDNVDLYRAVDKVPALMTRQMEEESTDGDYWVDEKQHQVVLSEKGHENAERILSEMGLLPQGESLYAPNNMILMHHLLAALRAHNLYHKDQHYVVTDDGEVVIVDEFTGRLMEGRRWSEGLHQAVEAKEGVEIKQENQTLASITFQNYFRLYEKLAGMTGTADTEAYEFQNIYNLETVIIPTNLPMIRKDYNDQVFRTAEEKYEAVIADIKKCYENGQPVLVGTTSIETSELVSDLLNKERLPHNVLNAKEHEKEAYIVAQAGKPKMITVATNMAGRGTDIVLGGNIATQVKQIEEDDSLSDSEKQNKINQLKNEWERLHEQVIQAGGLHIIGTERHESRRIDNQLRGRAGRQGDPGSSRFYLSFEDQLLRLFALDRAAAIINRLAPERGVAIEHGMLTRQIEGAQRKVESRNFDIRKQLLEYDNVANDQRKVVYHIRNEILDGETTSNDIAQIRQDVIAGVCDDFIRPDTMEEEWDISGLEHTLAGEFGVTGVNIKEWLKADSSLDTEDIKQRIVDMVESDYAAKVDMVGADGMAGFERNVMLNVIDQKWREHLAQMDNLRQGIHLRGYAQKNPKQEYKREAFGMFQTFMSDIYRTATRYLTAVRIQIAPTEEEVPDNHADNAPPPPPVDDGEDYSIEALEARGIYITRNDPCPCGSGEKYKNCHGKLA
ncbi:MAG: preprotein translocase subunit SecA [Neisseriaceae bacterium]|nr:preprotein translocase subunit SecA [Neisseriaceae bacterium]